MSNFTNLAMQNRQAEAMRKKKKKQEMEDSLLAGSSGSDDSSGSSGSADSISSSNGLNYAAQGGDGGGTSMLAAIGGAVVESAVDYAVGRIQDKVVDTVKDAVGKMVREGGEALIEKGAKKLAKEGVEELAERGAKKLATKAMGKAATKLGLAMTGIGAPVAAAMAVYDIVDLGLWALTGKDISEHLGVDDWLSGKCQDAKDWFSEQWDKVEDANEEARKREEEHHLRGNTVDTRAVLKEVEEKKKKEMEEAEKAKKAAEQKLKEEAQNAASQTGDEDDEDEDEDEEMEDGQSSGQSATKSGLMSGLKHTAGVFGGTMVASLSMVGVYRIHYSGEFEYKGISGEYQTSNYLYQNFTDYDENGNVILKGLTKENKLVKTFYTKYSDKSYYAIVEDSEKYGKNMDEAYLKKNLLTPDELREQYPDIDDVNNREVMFQLNPDVLYVLDNYIHKGEVLYPQQFVKPVFYEESQENFALKDLVDTGGRILAQSQTFDSNGKPIKNSDGTFKTTAGIWDYGFASILRYQEHKVPVREITAPVKREVNKIATESEKHEGDIYEKELESGAIPGASVVTKDLGNRKKPAYIIDTAVTPGGTITNEITKSWQRSSEGSSTSTKKFRYSIKTGEKEKCVSEVVGGNSSESTDTPKEEVSEDTASVETREKTENQVCSVVPIYTVYEVVDHYETYKEEELPQYEGQPSSEGITGSEYFRDYINSYSNYYPDGLPSRLDFSVLENEEIKALLYDDDENSFGFGQNQVATGSSATKEEFEKAVFMGDSITVGLDATSTIPSHRVYATGGFTVSEGDKKYSNKIIEAKPPVIVISYGTNDAGYENVEKFIKDYKELITKFKEGIPGVKIYLNKIFPGDESKAKNAGEKKTLKNIPEHNAALVKIASETGVTLIDCTNIPNLSSFYNDAFHFKPDFYKHWISEMEKQIVGTTSLATASSTLGSLSRTFNMRTAVQLPPATTGEDRNVMEVLKIGIHKDSDAVTGAMQYMSLYEKYGQMYGIDPYIIASKVAGESGGNPNLDGAARGLMQLEKSVFLGKTIKAYNQERKDYDEVSISSGGKELFDPDFNVRVGTMNLANSMADAEYNILAGLQGYNFGSGGLYATIRYYLGGGTYDKSKHSTSEVKAYLAMNHSGWITAQYPGDKTIEHDYAETRADGGTSDNKHSARVWYSNEGWRLISAKGHGTPVVVERDLAHYAGDGSPWIMNKDGEVITLDGAASSFGNSSGGTPVDFFNAYLKTTWPQIMEKWNLLFPGQQELDEKLDLVKKGDYATLYGNYEKREKQGARSTALTLPRTMNLNAASLNKIDIQLVLNMMFALNQGNYLFKYDNMTEAEWKAMYTQLLSSPTGEEWDDGWIGFTLEDIFGIKEMDDLGTLFPTDIGVTPTISVPYGMLKNHVSGSEADLVQYNAMNFGIDIVVPPDTDVLTVADGTVIGVSKKADINSKYGKYVKIQHAKGTVTITANLKDVNVKVGDTLKLGDVIGTSGGECKSYKDNAIFYQMYHNGTLINPTWVITRKMTGFEDPIQGNNGVICGGGGGASSSAIGTVPYVETALQQTDKPYIYGTAGPNSFDCSGLVHWSMSQHGISIPRDSRSQRKACERISYESLRRGDLIFRHGEYGTDVGDTSNDDAVKHVMIYLGDNKILHASSPERGILVEEFKPRGNHTYGRYSQALAGSTSSQGGGVSSGCQMPGSMSGSGNYTWPVPESGRITAPFGEWRDGNTRQHKGIDIGGKKGGGSANYKISIVSASEGTVIKVNDTCATDGYYGNDCGGGWGNYVKIKDSSGKIWIYAHMTKNTITVSNGATVSPGQELGKMGNSGSSDGVHLHFEVREGGDTKEHAVDPLKYVTAP